MARKGKNVTGCSECGLDHNNVIIQRPTVGAITRGKPSGRTPGTPAAQYEVICPMTRNMVYMNPGDYNQLDDYERPSRSQRRGAEEE